MDILNFISWIKTGNYRTTLPTDVPNLLAIGSKDPGRDDAWLPMAVNAEPLQSLYNTGTVTQQTNITTAVTLNTYSGIITTVSSTLAANAKTFFTVNNTNVTSTSIIIASVQYDETAASIPVVNISDISNNSFKIVILNGGNAALNSTLKIHFLIINPQ